MRAKPFWDVSHAKWVLETFMKDLSHENDGLIFSPATDVRDILSDFYHWHSYYYYLSIQPYQPGRCNELLKWKPSDLNTVDFKLSITETRAEG